MEVFYMLKACLQRHTSSSKSMPPNPSQDLAPSTQIWLMGAIPIQPTTMEYCPLSFPPNTLTTFFVDVDVSVHSNIHAHPHPTNEHPRILGLNRWNNESK